MSSRRAIQIPCLTSTSGEVRRPSSRVGSRVERTDSPAFLMRSPRALLAITLCSMFDEPRRRMMSSDRVGTMSLRDLGEETSAFQTPIAALLTRPEVSQRQMNKADKTLLRLSAPRTSRRDCPAWVASSFSSSPSVSALPVIPVILKSRSPTNSTELNLIR